jgi:hypothetical protein
LAGFYFRRRKELFFETTRSNVWEPGENPGRLRHCDGYKFRSHRQREGGMRFEAQVRIPVGPRSSAPRFGALLRKEKDEASQPNRFRLDALNAFILRFAGVKVFCFVE